MRNHLLVSIIINNYNYGSYLGAAIESALNQTYPFVETIVVDDGSTDDSMSILAGYGNRVVALGKTNGGHASALNTGFKLSKGEIVIFLDSDDALLPTCVENVVAVFQRENVAKVHWPLWRIDRHGNRQGDAVPANDLCEGNLLATVLESGPAGCGTIFHYPPTSGNAWTRNLLEQVFPLPETVYARGGVDFLLSVLAPVFGQIESIPAPQGLYRVHGNNDTLKPIEDYIAVFFNWFENTCTALSDCLHLKGIISDPAQWPRDHWYHKIYQSIKDIEKVVPPHSSFILVDDNHWGVKNSVAGRKRFFLIDNNGQFFGPPADDETAIREIESCMGKGASHLVITWSCFWYLDYYSETLDYLNSAHKQIMRNERLVIFELESDKQEQNADTSFESSQMSRHKSVGILE